MSVGPRQDVIRNKTVAKPVADVCHISWMLCDRCQLLSISV